MSNNLLHHKSSSSNPSDSSVEGGPNSTFSYTNFNHRSANDLPLGGGSIINDKFIK